MIIWFYGPAAVITAGFFMGKKIDMICLIGNIFFYYINVLSNQTQDDIIERKGYVLEALLTIICN